MDEPASGSPHRRHAMVLRGRAARGFGRVAVTAAVAAVLAACGSVAPQEGVEKEITSQLGAESATCPGDLEGEVGRSITCSATTGGETYDVIVTVTSLQGRDINVHIERVGAAAGPVEDAPVDATAGAVDGQEVATAVTEQLAASVGQQPDRVTCPDLPATVGASIRCELLAGPDTLGVTVTTSAVQDGRVEFDIKVDETPS
jgi:hypothetical protein